MWDCSSLVQLLAAPAAMPLTDAEVYSRLVPLRRWRAHTSAVTSIEIVPQIEIATPRPADGADVHGGVGSGERAMAEPGVSALLITASLYLLISP